MTPGTRLTRNSDGLLIGELSLPNAGVFMDASGNISLKNNASASVSFSSGGVSTASGGLLTLGNVGTVAAAGSDQAGAGAITAQITYVTAADGTKGVRLPAVTAGAIYIVYSTVATNGLKVYPASGDDINDGTGDASITIEGKTMAIFIGMDTSTWGAIFTANT